MEKYRHLLQKEIQSIVIEYILLLILILMFFAITYKLLNVWIPDVERKIKAIVYSIFPIIILGISISLTFRISKPVKDLKNQSFITYVGEVEVLKDKGNRYTDVYLLNDSSNTQIESANGVLEYSIKKCNARVVYAENSKKLLDIEIHDVIDDSGSNIIIRG